MSYRDSHFTHRFTPQLQDGLCAEHLRRQTDSDKSPTAVVNYVTNW
jgi:hypothetical protein